MLNPQLGSKKKQAPKDCTKVEILPRQEYEGYVSRTTAGRRNRKVVEIPTIHRRQLCGFAFIGKDCDLEDDSESRRWEELNTCESGLRVRYL